MLYLERIHILCVLEKMIVTKIFSLAESTLIYKKHLIQWTMKSFYQNWNIAELKELRIIGLNRFSVKEYNILWSKKVNHLWKQYLMVYHKTLYLDLSYLSSSWTSRTIQFNIVKYITMRMTQICYQQITHSKKLIGKLTMIFLQYVPGFGQTK